jgi:subtilase family serine protease
MTVYGVVFYKAGFPGYGLVAAMFVVQLSHALPTQAAQTKVLEGHVPAAIAESKTVQSLPPQTTLDLTIGLPLANRPALTNLLGELYDPASPNFHRFLTPDEFTRQFGPSEQDYQTVISFLATNGFKIKGTHPNRTLIDASASAANVERAFHLKMKLFKHPKEARNFFSPDSEPTIDAALPILHISGLDNFIVPRPAGLQPLSEDALKAARLTGSGPSGSYRGADFRNAYAAGVTLSGSGQMVGLLQFDGYFPSDITAYESSAGLPNVPLQNVLLNDISGVGNNNVEVALDIEMAVSMAPGLSAIIVYEGQSGNTILNRMATDNLAKQLSASWTFGVNSSTDQIFQQFQAQGQSYFNASGDNGAYSGAISTPCDSPYITAVGGTTLTTGSGATWSSEKAWNWLNTGRGNAGTGGGISTRYGIPTWQQGIDMTSNQGSATMRNIPDVAMIADNVFVISDNGKQSFVGGTSVASPLWAAFMALVNQQAAARGNPPVGFLNPAVYAIGKGASYASAFHDIQAGNNTNSSSPALFSATSGYDLATGWGTPIGLNLINLLAPAINSRVVTNDTVTLATETCAPTNGVIDSGETVTVNFGLRNIGAVDATNLVATLQEAGGVLAPSAPQSYGALAGGGAPVTRSFTFTAGGSCGSVITAALQLQDGAAGLGTLNFTFQTGVPNIPFSENFDSIAVPAVSPGWTTATTGAASNAVATVTVRDSTPNSIFFAEPPFPGVSELISPAVAISTTSARMTFRNNYLTEIDPSIVTSAYDGGVLEIKIGTGAFTDVLSAGGTFATGGYNKTIDPTDDNPLPGRRCWSGASGGFITTIVNLPAAAAGKTVQFKWRFATDTGNSYGQGGGTSIMLWSPTAAPAAVRPPPQSRISQPIKPSHSDRTLPLLSQRPARLRQATNGASTARTSRARPQPRSC